MLPANAVAQALIVGIGAKTGTQVLRDGVPQGGTSVAKSVTCPACPARHSCIAAYHSPLRRSPKSRARPFCVCSMSLSQKRLLMKYISRQFGGRFLRETDTCSQPSPSLAMTWSVNNSKGIKNAPLLPIASLELNAPSRIRYSFGTLNILLYFYFVSFILLSAGEGKLTGELAQKPRFNHAGPGLHHFSTPSLNPLIPYGILLMCP